MPRAAQAESVRWVEADVDRPGERAEQRKRKRKRRSESDRTTRAETDAKAECIEKATQAISLGETAALLKGLSDLQLLDGLRAGSEPHFNELYSRYFQRIYSFVYTRMRNHADAEEVVQETFTAVYRSFESYRGTASLLSWIYGIAKNTLNNSLRRAKTEDQHLDAIRPEMLRRQPTLADCNPEEHLNLVRYTEAIHDRLETVTEWQSEIFAMRHLENMSIQEISSRTQRSSDAVRSSLYRVKRMLFETADLLSDTRAAGDDPRGRVELIDGTGGRGVEMRVSVETATEGEAWDEAGGAVSLRGALKS